MTSRFMTRLAVGLIFSATCAATLPAVAQTSLGWGQHVSRYGSGYVGNAPNTIPMTSYYRSPAIAAQVQPTTSFYAPSGVAQAGYSPGVSYRVGTPNAAAYSSAYSPIVTPTTPYAANWQYPPQTVMPTVANYAPTGYGPTPPRYVTNYAQVPVTYYRPVTAMSPAGAPYTALQPCTGSECQAQRKHWCCLGWLFNHHRQPAATSAGYPCASGNCGQPAPLSVPYYTPGPAATTTVTPGVTTTVPANIAPTLSGPPPATGTTVMPSTPFGNGTQRVDYPPAEAYVAPPTTYIPPAADSFPPNVSSPSSAGQLLPLMPSTPVIEAPAENGLELERENGREPADRTPSLNGPSNAPIGSGVQPEANDGSQLQYRGPVRVEPQQPGPIIRRDSNITPIPDPEYTNGTRAKVNKAPQLLKPSRDRTAQTTPEARLAAFEQETPVRKPAAAPAPRKVLGDDIWRSAK